MKEKVYLAIDLKSFYASLECIERKLDPLKNNLVVADTSRTEKTICLAVSPAFKEFGISSRPRLYEVTQEVKKINDIRLKNAPNHQFTGESYNIDELRNNKNLKLSYIAATPQMSHYITMSNQIYSIYLKYVNKDDIHVYSIDEVFIDISNYLVFYKCTPSELASKIIREIFKTTGITATCGIGTNLFLAKVAMDIIAKHSKPNEDGVRIGYLDEQLFRKLLWDHRPLTDFWRIGPGTEKRLNAHKMFTLGDVCLKSIEDEDLLYEIFGVNAELIIDHAWGYEPTEIKDIKEYKPEAHSLSIGQVLTCGYEYSKAKTIIKEMSEQLSLDLLKKNLVTDQITISIMYDKDSNLNNYHGPLAMDFYGHVVAYPSHGTIHMDTLNNSTTEIQKASINLFDTIVNKDLLVRRVFVVATNVIDIKDIKKEKFKQLSLLEDNDEINKAEQEKLIKLKKDEKIQKALLKIKAMYGKNAVIKGTNLLDGATQIDRNKQIGGHKA